MRPDRLLAQHVARTSPHVPRPLSCGAILARGAFLDRPHGSATGLAHDMGSRSWFRKGSRPKNECDAKVTPSRAAAGDGASRGRFRRGADFDQGLARLPLAVSVCLSRVALCKADVRAVSFVHEARLGYFGNEPVDDQQSGFRSPCHWLSALDCPRLWTAQDHVDSRPAVTRRNVADQA